MQEEYEELTGMLKAEMEKGKENDEVELLMRETFDNRREKLKQQSERPMHYMMTLLPGFSRAYYVS